MCPACQCVLLWSVSQPGCLCHLQSCSGVLCVWPEVLPPPRSPPEEPCAALSCSSGSCRAAATLLSLGQPGDTGTSVLQVRESRARPPSLGAITLSTPDCPSSTSALFVPNNLLVLLLPGNVFLELLCHNFYRHWGVALAHSFLDALVFSVREKTLQPFFCWGSVCLNQEHFGSVNAVG